MRVINVRQKLLNLISERINVNENGCTRRMKMNHLFPCPIVALAGALEQCQRHAPSCYSLLKLIVFNQIRYHCISSSNRQTRRFPKESARPVEQTNAFPRHFPKESARPVEQTNAFPRHFPKESARPVEQTNAFLNLLVQIFTPTPAP